MKKLPLIALIMLLTAHFAPIFAQIAFLSEEEQQDLQYMLEEEKLARDVYVALSEKWDHPAFKNISASEDRHFASVKLVAEKHNLQIPQNVVKDQTGKFDNKELQALYTELVNTGSQSLIAALQVGAKIEELDIKDLEAAMARTQNEQLTGLYTRLQSASQKHLRSFTQNLKQQGVDYTPMVLSQEQYNNILKAAPAKGGCCAGGGKHKASCQGEKGKGKAAGCGTGGGKGKGKGGCCVKQ